MPRVTSHKKNKVGTFRCDKCSEPIIVGQEFYSWAFRYGGKHYQHTSHGAPTPSQLTQSKLSAVYAAAESAESAIASAESVDDLTAALSDCISEVETVRDEYQESIDAMPENLQQGGPAQEMQEKIDALEEFISELESARDNLEEFEEEEPEDDEAHAKWEEDQDEHLEGQRSEAETAVSSLSV